jgi:hypothetical protein
MTSKAVAPREAPKVPDLVRTPAQQITSDDVIIPRIKLGQYMSPAVQDELVKFGSVFATSGKDDADPQVLWTPGDAEGVRFYVLRWYKAKSYTPGDGEPLEMFDFDDPNAPAEAWVTYNFVIAIPSVEDFVPFRLLLTKSGKNAALQILTILKKNARMGPDWNNAFSLTASTRENKKGKFTVPRVAVTTAIPSEVTTAEGMALDMASAPVEHVPTEQPAI